MKEAIIQATGQIQIALWLAMVLSVIVIWLGESLSRLQTVQEKKTRAYITVVIGLVTSTLFVLTVGGYFGWLPASGCFLYVMICFWSARRQNS